MTNPIALAARAKGPLALARRAGSIIDRYGLTPAKMDQALYVFAQTIGRFGCGASFPLTAVALKRNRATIARYLDQNIEFAVHGYTHVDYSRLAPEEQLTHLRRARAAFAAAGIPATGFRSPYLSRQTRLQEALRATGFSWVSSQPILWDVLDADAFTPAASSGYARAIAFYAPWSAGEHLSLPRLDDTLVEIPVSLPDDEILLDRLGGVSSDLVEKTWRRILSQTYQRGELFTLQLHPERIAGCAQTLAAVLAEARTLTPPVWFARLDEIAAWWQARSLARVEIADAGNGGLRLAVTGPQGVTVLARCVETDAPTLPWADGYRQVEAKACTVRASLRPFIGLAPTSSLKLADLLRQQGYIVEISREGQRYSYYIDQVEFAAEQERSLIAQIEETDRPLVRLGRWPNGARSALAVTGDIDALTLWDYGLRFLGR